MKYRPDLRRFLIGLGLALILSAATVPLAGFAAASGGTSSARHVIVLLVDNTSVQNWAYMDLRHLHALAKEGSTGLMNSNTAGQTARAATLLTMGASAHLNGAGPALAMPVSGTYDGVSVTSLVQGLSGISPPKRAIYDLNWGQDTALNIGLPYAFTMGALGEEITQHGGRTAVFGNGDLPVALGSSSPTQPPVTTLDRSGVDLAANAEGIVDSGDVSDNLLTPVKGAPYGVALNNKLLLRDVLAALPNTELTVVDYGDTVRADAWRHLTATPAAADDATAFALHHFDDFLGMLLPHLDLRHTLLVVVSSVPSSMAKAGNETLTPILVVGPGITPGGLLSSGTTHRLGIVSNVDVTPTILSFLHLPLQTTFFGAPVYGVPSTGSTLSSLSSMGSILAFQSGQRLPVLKTLVYYIVLVFLAAILYLILAKKKRPHVQSVLSWLTLSVLYVPLAILLAPLGHPMSLGTSFALIIGFTVLATFVTLRLARHPLDRILIPCVLVSVSLIVDLATGQHLIQNSALGYDPQIGARYYGIGNEYMGVLVGATAIGFTALLERYRRVSLFPLVLLVFVVVIGFMVAPGLGTKAGGAITATSALAVVTLRLTGRRVGWRQILGVAGGILVLLVLLVAADLLLHHGSSQTDIGRAGLLIFSTGPQAALDIISRKLATNLSLVQGSYWTILFVVALGTVVAFLTILLGAYQDIASKFPRLGYGLIGSLVGAGVGFVFNDTGVVAACTCIIFPIATALLLDLDRAPISGILNGARPSR